MPVPKKEQPSAGEIVTKSYLNIIEVKEEDTDDQI